MDEKYIKAWLEQAFDLPLASVKLDRLKTGGNNLVYRFAIEHGEFVVKKYFTHGEDTRERMKSELKFLEWASLHAPGQTPTVIKTNTAENLAVFDFIKGELAEEKFVSEAHVYAAAKFIRSINLAKNFGNNFGIPNASEANFSILDHYNLIERRITLLRELEVVDNLSKQVADFGGVLRDEFESVKKYNLKLFNSSLFELQLSKQQQIISPSDFGFHNAIKCLDGKIVFIDFEYAGWDDPAKLVCDFFSQVKIPVSMEYFCNFIDAAFSDVKIDINLRERCQALIHIFRLKWCCIILNCFLPVGNSRRRFSMACFDNAKMRDQQFKKAINYFNAIRKESYA